MATVAPEEIEPALREALPADLSDRAPALARQIAAAAAGAPAPVSTADAQRSLAPALRALAGQELRAGEALISFAPGAQTGDITIGDVAGGDIVTVTLVLAPERRPGLWERAPLLLLLALLALALAGAAAAYANLPTTMAGPSSFKIAVADIAGPDGRPDPRGAQLGALIYRSLLQQQEQYLAVDSGDVIAIWHDSMGPFAKRAAVGVVGGATDAAREDAARAALARLGADLLVYGERDAAGLVTLRFYADPPAGAAPATIAGAYQLGAPLDPDGTRLSTRAGALFWLIKALQDDYEGDQEQMRVVLNRAEQALPGWRKQGEGKEILRLFRAQAALWLAQRAPDQARFETLLAEAAADLREAREANPAFVRAPVVAVSVATVRAQCLIGVVGIPCPPLPPDGPERAARLDAAQAVIDEVFASYPAAVAGADTSVDRFWGAGVAPSVLGFAHYLRGEIAYLELDDARAEAAYAEAAAMVAAGLGVLAESGDRRLIASYHLLAGRVAMRRAEIAPDEASRAARRAEARAAFGACVAQGAGVDDAILQLEVVALCERAMARLDAP